MIATALGFLVRMAGGKVRLAIWALAIAGFAWWHLHATAVAYSDGAAAGRENTLKEQAKVVDEKVRETLAAYAQERDELATQRTALAAERKTLLDQRRQISSELNAGIAKLTSQDATIRYELQNITDADIVTRYRLALSRARSAEATRATQP